MFYLSDVRGKKNSMSEYKHSLYSLRHTAICVRLMLSKGHVNIYSLAKKAGTSVTQIGRFCARKLSAIRRTSSQPAKFGVLGTTDDLKLIFCGSDVCYNFCPDNLFTFRVN
jgi:hypothetical protein